MRLRQCIFVFLSNGLATAASCGTTTVTSQSDADNLNTACPTVTGDVILSTNAAGAINFNGIQVIEGNLASDNCSNNCSSVSSLSSSTLVSITQDITLQNLTSLDSISIPALETVGGQFYLDSLPTLQNLSIHNLSSVGKFHLVSAPKLLSMDLSGIQKVAGQNPSIEIISVGLSDLQGFDVETNLSSFIIRDTPNLTEINLGIPQIDYLELVGNGLDPTSKTLGLSTSSGSDFIHTIGTLNISGCGVLDLASATTYENILLANNTFADLNLPPVKVLNNLTIVDNLNLVQALLPTDMSMRNIEIRGNLALFNPNTAITAGTGTWPWGITNISSMIFDGTFDPEFFNGFENFTLVEVSREFSLSSTNDLEFDCSFLNSLRKQGYFQGNYSCQGKTAAAGKVRTTAGSPSTSGSTAYTSSLSLSVGIMFSVACLILRLMN